MKKIHPSLENWGHTCVAHFDRKVTNHILCIEVRQKTKECDNFSNPCFWVWKKISLECLEIIWRKKEDLASIKSFYNQIFQLCNQLAFCWKKKFHLGWESWLVASTHSMSCKPLQPRWCQFFALFTGQRFLILCVGGVQIFSKNFRVATLKRYNEVFFQLNQNILIGCCDSHLQCDWTWNGRKKLNT